MNRPHGQVSYFIGFTHSLRGHLFEANRASRRLARNIERYLQSQQRTTLT